MKDSLSLSRDEVLAQLQESFKRYYSLKLYTIELRELWLHNLAAIKAKHSGNCQQSIYNNLIQQERQRRVGRRLKRVTEKTYFGGLVKVSVQSNN